MRRKVCFHSPKQHVLDVLKRRVVVDFPSCSTSCSFHSTFPELDLSTSRAQRFFLSEALTPPPSPRARGVSERERTGAPGRKEGLRRKQMETQRVCKWVKMSFSRKGGNLQYCGLGCATQMSVPCPIQTKIYNFHLQSFL